MGVFPVTVVVVMMVLMYFWRRRCMCFLINDRRIFGVPRLFPILCLLQGPQSFQSILLHFPLLLLLGLVVNKPLLYFVNLTKEVEVSAVSFDLDTVELGLFQVSLLLVVCLLGLPLFAELLVCELGLLTHRELKDFFG